MDTYKSFYNVVFSTYLRSNAAENEYLLITVLHISGLYIYLEIKIKSSYLKLIFKLYSQKGYSDIYLKLQTSEQFSSCAEQ